MYYRYQLIYKQNDKIIMGNSMSNQHFFGMTPSELDKILHRHAIRGLTQPGGILALSVLWLRGYGPISSYLNLENCLPQTN